MADIFFTSDTHFGHANILKFTDSTSGERIRPEFATVEEMDEHLVERWNSVVKPCDKVYHLGDVGFDTERTIAALKRLNGTKRLILGNHDDWKKQKLGEYFGSVRMWRLFKEYNFIASHAPLHESCLYKVKFNVHGHNHQNPDVSDRHLNISVERTNYAPISIDEVVLMLSRK